METRIYLIKLSELDDRTDVINLTNDEWIETSEEQGQVYSLKGFERAFNEDEDLSQDTYIKILTTKEN